MKLLVVADDFTGALDTGVQFSKAGVATMVGMDARADLAAAPERTEVLVVDTESRHRKPEDAAGIVGGLCAAAARCGVPYVYKKTDSTLRGNLGAEIQAAMDALGNPVMFVPAFPQAGRTTQGGRQLVDGVPLERTAFARDPLNPMSTSIVADILRAQADVPVENIAVNQGPADLAGRNTVYVFDGATDGDLARTGALLRDAGKLRLTAGCAGFAGHLCGLLGLERGISFAPALPGRVLLVCGSVNESSLRQLERTEALGYARMAPDGAELADAAHWESAAGREMMERAAHLLREHGRLAIQSALPGGGRLDPGRSAGIARSLGKLACGILERAEPCTLAVFGGDTAMGIMAEAGCTGLLPLDELEPGVPLSRMLGGRFGGTYLVSKAGGLGGEAVLQTIEDYVRRSGGK